MSWIAGLVVHARAGEVDAVRDLLTTTPEIETVQEHDGAFAVVLEATRPKVQESLHEALCAHPAVERAELVFQSSQLEES
jgi:nitrate reductase NapAB chaperone NapD